MISVVINERECTAYLDHRFNGQKLIVQTCNSDGTETGSMLLMGNTALECSCVDYITETLDL